MRIRGSARLAVLAAAGMTALAPAMVDAASPTGYTTEERTVVPGAPLDPAKPGFLTLTQGPGWARVTRELVPGQAQAGRETRRRSLVYFTQLTDFQLADEESPARVEFSDGTASSAWRPEEAFNPFGIDAVFRQLNAFTAASPVAQGGGARAQMDFALTTGDNADNQQYNENLWVRLLLEGGQALTPNSGVKSNYESCAATSEAWLKWRELTGSLRNEPTYMGVQDFTDQEANTEDFYDPNQPQGQFAQWPRYPGLMDRAQQTFTPVGLRRGTTSVPTYLANGNHDGLVQGNSAATSEIEGIALGCWKPLVPEFEWAAIFEATVGSIVRNDPNRRFVDKAQLRAVYQAGTQRDGHGFSFVDATESRASRGAASYYAWDPKAGIRFISIDTISEGGVIAQSAEGNLDDPQYQWLRRQITEAEAANKLIVVFGHHPIRSLTANVSDEEAPRCTRNDSHGHDVNPGCDRDPRTSTPLHLGADVQALFNAHPHVVAYVAGHTHENKVMACGASGGCPAGANWWEVNTASEVDWPQESRLIEIMGNGDGTLSIFGTLVDHAAAYELPAPGSSASSFTVDQLASLDRAFSYNDPQGNLGATGESQDRNVELLLDDPRS